MKRAIRVGKVGVEVVGFDLGEEELDRGGEGLVRWVGGVG
jgi:hypothetical protein